MEETATHGRALVLGISPEGTAFRLAPRRFPKEAPEFPSSFSTLLSSSRPYSTMHVVPGSSLFLLLALCCLSARGWQIRDRIGDNELEERIIYPGKARPVRITDGLFHALVNSSAIQERCGAGKVTRRPIRTN